MTKYEKSGYSDIFQEIELILVFNKYDKLLDYAFSNNSPSIIDKLILYDNTIIESINKLKNTNFNYPIKGKKIFKLLNIKL